ncbi:hypothetical protein [uncultured Acidaminococcus sp.]|jgi:hypothetical protein|uniref:hypothetical protein n=1 Tax=uncultured Acidaminococcus sp. TaxID=352152 RepID=UPI0025D6BE09|nr:hypothetical protein [uncultured Acidaminococcus sp.]
MKQCTLAFAVVLWLPKGAVQQSGYGIVDMLKASNGYLIFSTICHRVFALELNFSEIFPTCQGGETENGNFQPVYHNQCFPVLVVDERRQWRLYTNGSEADLPRS